MKEIDSGSETVARWHVAQNEEQAKLLTDPAGRRWLEPFLGAEKSLSEVAAELGCALDTLLYRVRKLQHAGLVDVVRVQKRAGRPIKIYRAVADGFFVPFGLTPFAALEERILAQTLPHTEALAAETARMLQESAWLGSRVYRNARGEVWNDSAPLPQARRERAEALPITFDVISDLYLGDDDARQLQDELAALWSRYQAKSEPPTGKRRYLFQLAFVPTRERG